MKTNHKNKLVVAIAAAAALPLAHADTGDIFSIEEIVVTAQKREQNLQEVPIALSAFSGDTLSKANIDDLNNVVYRSPGLAGQNNDSNSLTNLSVRGISTSDFGIGGDLSVGVYENGVYRPRSGGALGFYDMERVEILKGPQGLLFGRNATSGAISAITHRPSNELEAEFSFGAYSRDGREASATFNLPINDQLAVRIAANHEEEDGYIENRATGSTLLGLNRDELRVSVRYDISDQTTTNLVLDYSDLERTGGNPFYRTESASGAPFTAIGAEAGGDNIYDINHNFDGYNEGEYYGAVLDINTELSDKLSLTSITGYRNATNSFAEDFDGSTLTGSHYSDTTRSEYFSQELRLNYDSENLSWFLGISGYDQNVSGEFSVSGDSDHVCLILTSVDCATLPLVGGSGDPDFDLVVAAAAGYSAINGTAFNETSTISGDSNGWAVFGEASYFLTENLNLSLGLRYTYDEKEFERAVLPFNNPIMVIAGLNGGFITNGKLKNDDSWNDLSPRIALSYTPSEDITLYGTISKGYKAGGFDSFGFATQAAPTIFTTVPLADNNAANSFDPEEIMSYELGVKSLWLENTLQVNGSVYYYDYEDMQLISRSGNAYVIDNVGKATGQGVELELRYLPNNNWELIYNAAYSDTEANLSAAEDAALCGDSGVQCDGNRLPGNPRWSTMAIATYHTVIASNIEWFVTAEHSYQDSNFGAIENTEAQKSDSHQLINLRTGLSSDAWSLTFYVENLEDKEFHAFASSDATGTYRTSASVPRTAGVSFNYSL